VCTQGRIQVMCCVVRVYSSESSLFL
jgi:hypothetical protein